MSILNDKMHASSVSTTNRLAHRLEGTISRSQLYDLMDGKRTMDLPEFLAICEALDVTPSEVFAEAYGPSAEPPASDVSDSAG